VEAFAPVDLDSDIHDATVENVGPMIDAAVIAVNASAPPPEEGVVAPPLELARRGRRQPADAVVEVVSGTIKLYQRTHRMVAECNRHPACFLTRTTLGSAVPARFGQGRPLGLLVAWLEMCLDGLSRFEHVHHFTPSAEERFVVRGIVEADHRFARLLAPCGERPLRDGNMSNRSTFRDAARS
jgi:hypothetical protein